MLRTLSAAERSPGWGNGEGGAAGDMASPCQQLPTCNTEVRLGQSRAKRVHVHADSAQRDM